MLLAKALLSFLFYAMVFLGVGLAAQAGWRRTRNRAPTPTEVLLLNATTPAVLGYLAFFAYFAHPVAGRIFSWAVMGTAALTLVGSVWRRGAARDVPNRDLLRLGILAGCGYIALLLVYPAASFSATARDRFLSGMPGDDRIPAVFTELIYDGVPAQRIGGDWLSSDRPPLQTGITLLALPALRAADIDYDMAGAAAGVWFQLLWIPALWLFLKWLGATERAAVAGCAALVFTGFLMFNSVFVWPKLGAAALVLLGFCTFFPGDEDGGVSPGRDRWRFALGGGLCALGSLAHGGVMFSLVALAVLSLIIFWRAWRGWLLAAVVFALISAPWLCYQRFYAPPGNRLVKWHIAGVIAPDNRGVLISLRDNYRQLGLAKALETRRINAVTLFAGDWRHLLDFKGGFYANTRRVKESAYTFRTAAAWIFGLGALPFVIGRWMRRGGIGGTRHALAAAWLVLGLIFWVGLMFFPNSVLVHQGSLTTQLVLLGLLVSWTQLAGRWWFAVLAALQCVLCVTTWAPPSPEVAVPASRIAAILCVGAAGAIAALFIRRTARGSGAA